MKKIIQILCSVFLLSTIHGMTIPEDRACRVDLVDFDCSDIGPKWYFRSIKKMDYCLHCDEIYVERRNTIYCNDYVSSHGQIVRMVGDNVCVTQAPTRSPTIKPTNVPSVNPTRSPTTKPTKEPTMEPTNVPTDSPVGVPTPKPTKAPFTSNPTTSPSTSPTVKPTSSPTVKPTMNPSMSPTEYKTSAPSSSPIKSTYAQKFIMACQNKSENVCNRIKFDIKSKTIGTRGKQICKFHKRKCELVKYGRHTAKKLDNN